jgi:molecular chaperone GrpE
MNKKKDKPGEAEQLEMSAASTEEPRAGGAGAGAAGAVVEPPEAAVGRLEAQLAELADRHLRLAAEYDNFRKRTIKERSELRARAQAEFLQRLADALDDLARFAHADPAQIDAQTLREGVGSVERKFWKELEAMGVQRVDQVGVPFDPTLHEAVTAAATDDPSRDQTVGAVLQPGYRLGELLVRPARVQVLTRQGKPD